MTRASPMSGRSWNGIGSSPSRRPRRSTASRWIWINCPVPDRPGPLARPPVRLGAAASRAVPHPETRRRARHQSWQEFIALSPASVAVILVQAMPRQSSDPGRIVCRTRSLSVMAFRQATCSAGWVRGSPRDQVDHTSWALSRGVASGDRPAHGRTAGFPGSGPACRAYRGHARLDSATSSLMLGRLTAFLRSGRAGVDIGQTGAESWTVLVDTEETRLRDDAARGRCSSNASGPPSTSWATHSPNGWRYW
jgi:hypothetical protein